MSKTMFIAYRHGGIVPASVAGKPDQKVAAHEAVEVPVAYGRSLVDDRFAYEVEPRKKKHKAKPADTKDGDKVLSDLEAAVDAAKAKLANADLVDQEAAAAELASAEKALADAQAAG